MNQGALLGAAIISIAASPAAADGFHVGAKAGQSSWGCTSNDDCGVEAGTEQYETASIAGGFSKYSVRFELEAGYRRHEVHGLNGDLCHRKQYMSGNRRHGKPKGYTPKGTAKCRTDRNLRVWNATAGLYPTLNLFENFSIYGGGGIGVVVADGLGQSEHSGVWKGAAGVEARVTGGLWLDVGYEGIGALGDMTLSGYELRDYESHGVYAGLRYRF